VLSVVTPITVKMVSRSLMPFSPRGSTEEMASAAEAPQMPTEPPVRIPKSRLKPRRRASKAPNRMVSVTPHTVSTSGLGPSLKTSSTVMRAPRRATPIPRMVREEKATPGMHRPCGLM
jgi:hypothetical protein